MSELINNSQKRKELLKHMILQLHAGEAPDLVRKRLVELLKNIPYDEVVEVEQELISEGLPEEEVLQFCDLHTMVLEGHIDQTGAKTIPPGHPVDTFRKENRELEKVVAATDQLLGQIPYIKDGQVKELFLKLHARFNELMDVDKHYKRKEYLLFPFLEKYEITGPPKVMWAKHDEERVPDMIMKEEEILFPMCMDKLTDEDWYAIDQQTMEFGYCLYDPQDTWKPEGFVTGEVVYNSKNSIQLSTGSYDISELEALFKSLPLDITFVDRDDKVKFFSLGAERIFTRNRAILGRDVRMCHPPSSVHVVEQILSDFKSAKENSAAFRINMQGRFIYIEYFALRGKENEYLGTIEITQDLTHLRKLEGEQRLLSYSKKEH
jgi:uncharacterized protein